MSRFSDPLISAVAEARRNGFHGNPDLPDGTCDFNDPVDRIGALLTRLESATPDDAASMVSTGEGQCMLGATWAKLTRARRQFWRRRAGVLLDAAARGSELRSQPEENAA